MSATEIAEVLGADGLDALCVDFLDFRQLQFARHEQLTPTKCEKDGAFARALRRLVVRNEELRRACQISHAVRLPELAHFHRAQRSQTPGSARIRPIDRSCVIRTTSDN